MIRQLSITKVAILAVVLLILFNYWRPALAALANLIIVIPPIPGL